MPILCLRKEDPQKWKVKQEHSSISLFISSSLCFITALVRFYYSHFYFISGGAVPLSLSYVGRKIW